MNILYLSHLSGAAYAGPTYSVPEQIKAQSRIDNVFWYNAIKTSPRAWSNLPYYHDLTEYPNESIYELPKPFNRPDIIVVECFYNMFRSPLQKELINSEIPYVIIPRGELTKQAQNRKSFKKKIANILICRKYAQKAASIQYLTEQEYFDSGDSWNQNHIIIPNGINLPNETKKAFSRESIKCVSIGRIEPYQKGLDMLIEACALIRTELEERKCTIIICGPDKEGKAELLLKSIEEKGLSKIISIREGVYGDEKKELLLDSDVFLIPSRFEGHPMALIEALSYGLPCLATTGSNMRNEIDQYSAGWTADNTVDSIRNALLEMISDEVLFNKKNNALNLSKQYAWDSLASSAHESFERIIKR